MTKVYIVYRDRTTRTYGVYVQPAPDGTAQALVEGGFFSKGAALDARARYEQEASK